MSYAFLDNKYTKWYDHLCKRAIGRQLDVYSEKHHIIPRSFGGSDDQSNLVSLTAREHFIAHSLLTKMTAGMDKSRMFLAVRRMCYWSKHNPRDYKISSRTFAHIKHNATQYFVGLPSKRKGTTLSEESKQKIRDKRALQVFTPEQNAKRALGVAGSAWINNGINNKRVKADKLESMLQDGWQLGRTQAYITPEYKEKMKMNATRIWASRKQGE